MPKVLVIGLDGASPGLIESWKDELPNIKDLIEHGVHGVLKSTLPPITCPAWNCFATGKNPGKLGVYDFLVQEFDTRKRARIVDSTLFDDTVWEILSNHGKRVGVVNVPSTYPPKKVKGFMISGFLTPSEKDFTYPKDLKEELDEVTHKYKINPDFNPPQYMKNGEKGLIEEMDLVTDKHFKATKYLMQKFDWDFFIVVFMALDQIQHYFWGFIDKEYPEYDIKKAKRYGGTLKEFYIKMDRIVGELLKLIDKETNVLILSDHGFGPLHGGFMVNNWLEKHGLLKRGDVRLKNPINDIAGYIFNNKRIVKLLTRLGFFEILSARSRISSRRWILRFIPKRLMAEDPYLHSRSDLDIDWTRTKAYGYGYGNGIFINLKGRELEGIVEPGKGYEDLRNKIIELLYQVRDPKTGAKIVDRVYKKEELYWGEHVEEAHDLVYIIGNDRYTQGMGLTSGGIWKIPYHKSGNHTKDGVWIMSGPDIKKKVRIDASIMDLAPTILHLMDVPIPRDMDGSIIKNAFRDQLDAA